MNKNLNMILEKTNTGFSAYAEEYPIFTTGKTIIEVIKNAHEAANLYFEEENIEITQENIKFEVDFKQFFKYYRVLNSKFLAERIGMNPTLLSQYVSGHKNHLKKSVIKSYLGFSSRPGIVGDKFDTKVIEN